MQTHPLPPQPAMPAECTISPHTDGNLALTLIDRDHIQREFAEAFVWSVFNRAYGANLESFYPLLLGLERPQGGYAAIAGIRPAAIGAIFSEYYLEQPVHAVLSTERSGIVEIGNLAPASTGQARWLICAISAFLMGAGFSRVVFTSVPRLRNAFRRMGLPLTRLADAHLSRLPEDQQGGWGRYYDCGPGVYAGDIDAGTPALLRLMASNPGLLQLSRLARQAGKDFTCRQQALLP